MALESSKTYISIYNMYFLDSKTPYWTFEKSPARALPFIGVSILIETEALAGFAMPKGIGVWQVLVLNTVQY